MADGGALVGMDAYAQALQQSGMQRTNVPAPTAGGAMSQSDFNRHDPIDAKTLQAKQDNLRAALAARNKALGIKRAKGGAIKLADGGLAGMDAYAQALQQSGLQRASVPVPPSNTMSQSDFNRHDPVDPRAHQTKMDNLAKALAERDKRLGIKKAHGGMVHEKVHPGVHHLIAHVIINLAKHHGQ